MPRDVSKTPKYCHDSNQKRDNLEIDSIFQDVTHFESPISRDLSSLCYNDCESATSSLPSDDGTLVESDKSLCECKSSSIDESRSTEDNEWKISNTANKNAEINYVSREYFDNNLKKLNELKSKILKAQSLLKKMAKHLPDGGCQLQCHIDKLLCDLANKEKFFKALVIKDNVRTPRSIDNTNDLTSEKFKQLKEERRAMWLKNVSEWNELPSTDNKIKPIPKARQEMKTFHQQKTLTVEGLQSLHDSLEMCPLEFEFAKDPIGLELKLMPHQKHALAWMNWREKQKPRGGILADDMGLGKTLAMISLILDCKNQTFEQNSEDDDLDDDDNERNIKKFYQGGTLVVCPTTLLQQWESEILNKVSKHILTICVHHGNKRKTCPKHLGTYDIVLTTYNIVCREHKSLGTLFGVKWKRIILDEAHIIRNSNAQSSQAVCALRGKCRWVLTGTPIQNKEMDIYALLKFLRCTPFDDMVYWKKWIGKGTTGQERLNAIVKSLMLRRTKVQLHEIGTLRDLPQKTIKLIEVSLSEEEVQVYQTLLVYSRTRFVQYLYQRGESNLRVTYSPSSSHPVSKRLTVNKNEYYKLHENVKKMNYGLNDVKSHEIFNLLLRLRQICFHSGLIINASLGNSDSQSFNQNSDSEEDQVDLLEEINKLIITNDYDTNEGNETSATTVTNSNQSLNEVSALKIPAHILQRSNPVFDLKRPSSKINKVLSTVSECLSNNHDKVVIVSQWTSTLSILKYHLEQQGSITLSLNGGVPVPKRQDIIKEFNDSTSTKRILLLSLTTGGVGLNLSSANHLLLIDWHWNPQLEAQAQDRIYRMGQKKNVTIYKFICKGTIEERIKFMQERKLALADQVLTGDHISGSHQFTIDEMKSLFGI